VGLLAHPIAARLTTAQTPQATPDVDQVALYGSLREELLAEGRAVMDLVLPGDDAAIVERATPELREALSQMSVSGPVATLQVNRVRMEAARDACTSWRL
jgi:hypothetical protein